MTEFHYTGDLFLTRLEERTAAAMERARQGVLARVRSAVGARARLRATTGALVVQAADDVQRQVGEVLATLRAEDAARFRAETGLSAPPERPSSSRIHEVADLLEGMPRVELVGPEGSTRIAPEESLLAAVHEQLVILSVEPAPSLRMRGNVLVVRATDRMHDQVVDVLESTRQQLAGVEAR